ncbi:hypothetical protein QA596_04020 [Balneolales bacterium ANBcel1]|nr:hypothetical protein [Balneolales bacterium ANBcel1]
MAVLPDAGIVWFLRMAVVPDAGRQSSWLKSALRAAQPHPRMSVRSIPGQSTGNTAETGA